MVIQISSQKHSEKNVKRHPDLLKSVVDLNFIMLRKT